MSIFFGPGWALADSDKNELGRTGLLALQSAPSWLTAAIAKFTGPGVFAGELGAVLKVRLNAVAANARAAASAPPIQAAAAPAARAPIAVDIPPHPSTNGHGAIVEAGMEGAPAMIVPEGASVETRSAFGGDAFNIGGLNRE